MSCIDIQLPCFLSLKITEIIVNIVTYFSKNEHVRVEVMHPGCAASAADSGTEVNSDQVSIS